APAFGWAAGYAERFAAVGGSMGSGSERQHILGGAKSLLKFGCLPGVNLEKNRAIACVIPDRTQKSPMINVCCSTETIRKFGIHSWPRDQEYIVTRLHLLWRKPERMTLFVRNGTGSQVRCIEDDEILQIGEA
ncbi:MAG TPA: hypothetical protein VF541_18825, partial [Longimicrobium sp.]